MKKKKKTNRYRSERPIGFFRFSFRVHCFGISRRRRRRRRSADGFGPDRGQRGHRDDVHVLRTRRRPCHLVLRALSDRYVALEL